LRLGSRRSGGTPRQVTLTTRGAIVLGGIPLSALAGALLGAEELVLVAIALSVLLLFGLAQVSFRVRRDRGNWRLSVQIPASDAEIGGALALLVGVTAPERAGASPLWLEDPARCWRPVRRSSRRADRPTPTPQGLPSPATVVRVPPAARGATASFSFPAPTVHRGVFALRPLRLWCPDSLGLVARVAATGPSATITVHPAPVSIELHDDLLYGEQGADLTQPSPLAPTRSDSFGDFSGLRPYIPGDRLRLLYWPALARTGELMVREFEDAGSHRVQVVADVRSMIGPAGRESVLATAAAVGLQALAKGSLVELSTTAGERIAIGPGPHGPIELLRAVAIIELPLAPASRRWLRRRRPLAELVEPPLHPTSGRQLVVTTQDGAEAIPATFGLADLVIAP
jgi:uncharacterized protein (DUF58 family)